MLIRYKSFQRQLQRIRIIDRRVTLGTYKINENVVVSPECLNMVSSLLQKKPKARMGGVGMNGAGLILNHVWFKKFNVDALKRRCMAPSRW